MSWAAHEIEDYLAQKHLGTRVSFLALALGADAPDLLPWGGPRYVSLVDLSDATAGEVAAECLRGAVVLAAVLAPAWVACVRHLWRRAGS